MIRGGRAESGNFARRGIALAGVALAALLPNLASAIQAQTTEPERALAREILGELIAYRTTEGTGETVAAARAMADRLRDAGYADEDIHVVGPEPDLGNLVVRLRGSGGAGPPILLMAHMDVVPAVARAWGTDPYALVEKDGFYYGRGATDNKAGAATLVANLIRWKREGWIPARDVIVAITADEETTQQSIAWLVQERRDLVDAEFALNTDSGFGEMRSGTPVYFAVQAAEKMYLSFRLTATNPGGHSSVPRPDNAIDGLVGALSRIAAHRFPVRVNDITRGYLRATAGDHPPDVGAAMQALADDPDDEAAARTVSMASPYLNALLRTTCVATQLAAGHAENALPREASATVNCRIFPGIPADEIEETLRRLAGDPGITIERLQAAVPSPPSPLTPGIRETLEALAGEMFPTARLLPVMETGATDGLYTRNGGIPTYGVAALFEPLDDIRAHGQDERVDVDVFHDGVEFWYRMVKRLASAPTAS